MFSYSDQLRFQCSNSNGAKTSTQTQVNKISAKNKIKKYAPIAVLNETMKHILSDCLWTFDTIFCNKKAVINQLKVPESSSPVYDAANLQHNSI